MSQTTPSFQTPFAGSPQARTIITPIALAALPVGGPATLLAASPPQALVIQGSFEVALTVSAGAATVTPYAWIDSGWFPIGDNVNAPKLVSVDASGVASGIGRFISQSQQTLTWAFVKTGAGTISYCSVCGGDY
jgi:hypothetical protein